ncbi:MAG: hypothetical protein WB297_07145 [Actinomycetota bacterium]
MVRGTLREADLVALLDGTADATGGSVTLDLCNLDVLTPGGCWTIRNLADELWARGRPMTVVFPAGGHVAEVLRSTGTVEHSRMVFQISEGV